MRELFEESARVVGKSTKPEADAIVADAAADTVTNPLVPSRDETRSPEVIGPIEIEGQSGVMPGAQSSERIILSAGSKRIGLCLARHEVVEYLSPACPRELRARVEAHIADCLACRRWVRHVDDEILEYIGGQRAEEELARMDAHLDACKVCRGLMHHVLQGMAKSWHGDDGNSGDAGTTFVAGNVVNSRYLIRSFVGRGGMGEVYEALDRLMDRRIALKTMLCTVADRPRAARRFKEEVRNAQRVGHPHVCRINDLQEHDEGMFGPPLPFFTMEFVDGDRLGNRLLGSPLPLDDARVIALQLLDGLKAAHQRGVLHLDFKSDNVMLRRNAQAPDAVIMDFGLSRVLGSESKLRTSDRRQFAGTLPYMSVEQLECREDLGPATDIYAFGVVLYEILTRTLPFDGETLSAVLMKQLNERPRPPSRHRPELSRALDRFVLQCLKSDPRSRYADAGQALAALEAVGRWSRPRGAQGRLWKVAAPAALATAAGVLLVTSFRRPAPEDAGPSAVDSAPDREKVEPLASEFAGAPSAAPEPSTPSPAPTTTTTPEKPPTAVAHHGSSASTRAGPERARGDLGIARPRADAAPTPTHATRAAVEPASGAPTRSEPTRSESTKALPSTDDRATWKPSRVPRRLSVPAPLPSRDVESDNQKARR